VRTGITDGKKSSSDVKYGNGRIFDSLHFAWN
jgi:hypothetical protein